MNRNNAGCPVSQAKLVRNRDITRKLRGMAILFQEEMRLDARPAGEAPPIRRADGRTEISHASSMR